MKPTPTSPQPSRPKASGPSWPRRSCGAEPKRRRWPRSCSAHDHDPRLCNRAAHSPVHCTNAVGVRGGVNELRIIPIEGIREVRPGDVLAELIADAAALQDRDVVVV